MRTFDSVLASLLSWRELANSLNFLKHRFLEKESKRGEIERQRDTHREKHQFVVPFLCIHWLLLECAMTGD